MSTQATRVPYCNRQALGQRCGWSEGETEEAAIANGLAEKAGRNPRYDQQTGCIMFDGGCYC